ncbi:ATP-binding protein [Phaeacidiphilus oryzae]|uniref:ATP-binding protein n=1 Tax=Phaeacidiphilus oryzae TaxID=348818 RepID=UPI00068CC3B7
MDIWWSLHLRREPASVPLARRVLLDTMSAAGVEHEVGHDIATAFTEACANAVEHAARAPEAGDGFQVTVRIAGDRLHVQVIDSGPRGRRLPPVVSAGSPVPTGVLGAGGAARLSDFSGFSGVSAFTAGPGRSAPGRSGTAASRAAATTARPVRHARRHRTAAGSASGTGGGPVGAGSPAVARACRTASAADVPEGHDPGPRTPGRDSGHELPDPSAESGRGLFLIRALTDHVRFRAHPRRGTVVSFDKALRYGGEPLSARAS